MPGTGFRVGSAGVRTKVLHKHAPSCDVGDKVKKIALAQPILAYIRENLGSRPLTGSDIESILIRATEQAVLAKRDDDMQRADLEAAVN